MLKKIQKNNNEIRNILLLTPDFPPEKGGIQKLMFNLSNVLKISGYDIEVITLYKKYYSEFDSKQNFKISRIKIMGKRNIYILCSFFFYLPFILSKKSDLVISGHIITTIIGLIIKKIKNIPLITYTHALEIMDLRYRRIIRFLLRNSDLVIAVSDFTKNFIKKMGIKNVFRVYPPVDVEYFTEKKYDKLKLKRELGFNKKLILLTIARCDRKERYKGIDTIISVLPLLYKKFPNIHYIVVGGGNDLDRLKGIAKDFDVESLVTFTGVINDHELIRYIASADIFIMLSKQIKEGERLKCEGLGIVFLEAQAMGVPVIGGKSGGIPEIVIHKKTGLLSEPENKDDIINNIELIIKNKNLKKKIVNSAKKRIKKEFTIPRYQEEINNIIKFVYSK